MNLQREQSQVSELKRQRDLLTNESKKLNNIIRDQEEQYQRKKVPGPRSIFKFITICCLLFVITLFLIYHLGNIG